MTASSVGADKPPVPWHLLKPYISVIVLQCLDEDPSISFRILLRQLLQSGRGTREKVSAVVARSELTRAADGIVDGLGSLEELDIDQLFGIVRRKSGPPGWLAEAGEFVEVSYDLVLAIRRGNLVAVRADGNTGDRLQKWLDKTGQKQLSRIDSEVLKSTFMTGAAKGLWLRQVQRASRVRPTSKATTGIDLGEGLDPIEDSNYSMGSVRCEIPEDPQFAYLKGAVGVTDRNSQVWFKDSPDARTFFMTVSEVLRLIEAPSENVETGSDQFRYLAQEVRDLSQVSGAFEVSPIEPDSLPRASAGGEDLQGAAALLQEAVLKVRPGASKDRFSLDVGLDGAIGGTLAVKLKPVGGKFTLDVGFDSREREPLPPARRVKEALEQGDLIDIYYESGHKYSGGKLWQQNFDTAPFLRWEWANFEGIAIEREKPAEKKAPEGIHDAIGRDGDNSLFSWVVRTYNNGWLICDDGSGEAADFFHLSNDDVLSVIHVKAASSSSPKRTVSVGDYEVVVSQAAKNLVYTDREALADRLAKTTLEQPACWTQGRRTSGREEFLEVLAASRATGGTQIVVVQPHLTEEVYSRLSRMERGDSEKVDQLRLRLLEMLLHATRANCVRYGLDLKVVGSKA